jgi:hypothetical protein
MSKDQEQVAEIKVESLNKVLEYLAAKPYGEVVGLVSLIREANVMPITQPKAKADKSD